MLDDAESVAALGVQALDHLDDLVHQRRVDAGAGLVQQHQLRVGHHRPAQLQQLLLPAREVAGQFLAQMGQAEEFQRLIRPLQHLALARPNARRREPGRPDRLAGLVGGYQHQVLDHRQAAVFLRDLEAAHDAEMEQLMGRHAGDVAALEDDASAGRGLRPGDHVEGGGLAGAVRSDQPGDRAAPHLEAGAVDRGQAAIALHQLIDAQDRRGVHEPPEPAAATAPPTFLKLTGIPRWRIPFPSLTGRTQFFNPMRAERPSNGPGTEIHPCSLFGVIEVRGRICRQDGCFSYASTPSGMITQDCLLRVHKCISGFSQLVSSSVPGLTETIPLRHSVW